MLFLFLVTLFPSIYLSPIEATHTKPLPESHLEAIYKPILNEKRAKETLTFIANDLTKGRASGEEGSLIVASYLQKKLNYWGVLPINGQSYTQSFIIEGGEEDSTTVIGRNVIGVLNSPTYSNRYIVVSAHYDHLGVLGDRVFNGADDNASGVTALLFLAEWFAHQRYRREGPSINIIFALFDAKEKNMAGSRYFVEHLEEIGLTPSQIVANINIEQLGSSLAPPTEQKEYILYTASSSIRERSKEGLNRVKAQFDSPLFIDHTFYDSEQFYEIFLNISDQYSFIKAGIPAIMFTSGITNHTYKTIDTALFIEYPLLLKRGELIYYFISDFIK